MRTVIFLLSIAVPASAEEWAKVSAKSCTPKAPCVVLTVVVGKPNKPGTWFKTPYNEKTGLGKVGIGHTYDGSIFKAPPLPPVPTAPKVDCSTCTTP